MIYIYDILLNFSDNKVYDFFEWEKSDKLDNVKKIPMFRVNKNIIDKFLYKKVKIKEDIIKKVYDLTEVYTSKKVVKIPYAFIITDGLSALALKSDKYGNIKYRSKLIVDEEEEVLCLSSKLDIVDLKIENESDLVSENYLTRNEEKVKKYLLNIIEDAYKTRNFEKLKYLYNEYSNKDKLNKIDDIYNELIQSINNELEPIHYDLYNLFQLTTNKN